ncbi:MAG: hypothetical protein ABJA67_15820, partial [Chthonomonadales bacterium]
KERVLMKEIDFEHSEYRQNKPLWKMYGHLYKGGEVLKGNASDYLARRQKEPANVYQERLGQVFYENYVGSIIDWYVASLFRREPVILPEGEDPAGRQFLTAFIEDSDTRGTTISEFFRNALRESLVYGTTHAVLEFPRVTNEAMTRAEEEALGSSRAYLVHYRPDQLINWSKDERGDYEWVVLRTQRTRQVSVSDTRMMERTRWYYYDRENFRVYEREVASNGIKLDLLPASDGDIRLVDEGRHALAGERRVPLFSMPAADGMCLMEKASLLQLEHFNKSNALSWALTLGLFATPVVYTDREWSQVVGEAYYIQLGPNDKFGWTEPEGKVYQIAADNLTRLKEEIYRVCYLMTQAGGPSMAQSGLSKQRDFAVTQEMLRAYGDWVKDSIKRIIGVALAVRKDRIGFDVSGLDEFDLADFTTEIGDAERLLNLGIRSDTLDKQVKKKLAFQFLSDVRQAMKERIGQEIDGV